MSGQETIASRTFDSPLRARDTRAVRLGLENRNNAELPDRALLYEMALHEIKEAAGSRALKGAADAQRTGMTLTPGMLARFLAVGDEGGGLKLKASAEQPPLLALGLAALAVLIFALLKISGVL